MLFTVVAHTERHRHTKKTINRLWKFGDSSKASFDGQFRSYLVTSSLNPKLTLPLHNRFGDQFFLARCFFYRLKPDDLMNDYGNFPFLQFDEK